MAGGQDFSCANEVDESRRPVLTVVQLSYFVQRQELRNVQFDLMSDLVLVLHIHEVTGEPQRSARPIFEVMMK